jgi:tetratricopeptide (TPR) repeat protein
MDVDYMILGRYTFDGQSFTASAQLLDMNRLHLSPELRESGSLPKVLEVQNALAWQLLRSLEPGTPISREDFLASSPGIRLDAFENYIRGVVAGTRVDKVRHLREAVRLSPSYTQAMFELGRTYFANREYESAAAWFARVPKTEAAAREANFYVGLSAYYLGQYERAASAFHFLLSRFPLTEVYNNLGVVESRRGRKAPAVECFQRAVQADSNDPDYRFNLGVALYRNADYANAARHLQRALKLRPSDAESKALLDLLANGPAGAANAGTKVPLERIKRNYDETSFRQLALEIKRTTEERLAKAPPQEHAAYHLEHGRELLRQGFVLEALQELRESVVLDPANANVHAGLATALEQNQELAGARAEARTALRLQPTVEAYLVLARLDLRDNNVAAASDSVQRALALEPANAAALAIQRTVAARLAEKTQAK